MNMYSIKKLLAITLRNRSEGQYKQEYVMARKTS